MFIPQPKPKQTIRVMVRQIQFQEVRVEVPAELPLEAAHFEAIRTIANKEPGQRFQELDKVFTWDYSVVLPPT